MAKLFHCLKQGDIVTFNHLISKLNEHEVDYDEDQTIRYGWTFHDDDTSSTVKDIPFINQSKAIYITDYFNDGYWMNLKRINQDTFIVEEL